MSSTLIWASDGLNGPPTGTPSTMTRSASNSFSPQRPMFGRRDPLSLPSPVSRPTTSWSASASVRALRRRISSPVMTVAWPGISVSISGPRLAETTTFSRTEAGVGVGAGVGVVWAGLAAAATDAMVINNIAAFRERMALLRRFEPNRAGEKEGLLPQREGEGRAERGDRRRPVRRARDAKRKRVAAAAVRQGGGGRRRKRGALRRKRGMDARRRCGQAGLD